MNNSSSGEAQLLELLSNPFEQILAMLSRPVVQRQIVAIIIIMALAWILPTLLRFLTQRFRTGSQRDQESGDKRRPYELGWIMALFWVSKPILAIILLSITITLFAVWEYPNGLLQNLTTLIWIWLVYRGLVTILYTRYGAAVKPYQTRILTPIFLVIIFGRLLLLLPGADVWGAQLGLGSFAVSTGDILSALIILYLFVVGAWVLEQVMLHTLPARLKTEPGVVESIATVSRYALIVLGIVISLGVVGLDLSSLAIVAGGLSVGIGIGLQEIVSNFVSGMALLFEQSLRPGDVIELNGRISTVEKVSLRATTIRTRTNEEVIVPNNTFTQSQVTNLTKTDRLVQVGVPFGVSYASDVEQVRRLAVETSLQHPLVLADPAPALLFSGYGESSLDFSLFVSTNDPLLSLRIRSDLYFMMWTVFSENGISIPFPQRDLNLGDGWERLGGNMQNAT